MKLWSPRPKFYRPANHHADFHSDEWERHDDGHIDRGSRQFIQVYPAGSYVRIWMASGGRGDVPILFVFPVRRFRAKAVAPRLAGISPVCRCGCGRRLQQHKLRRWWHGGWKSRNHHGDVYNHSDCNSIHRNCANHRNWGKRAIEIFAKKTEIHCGFFARVLDQGCPDNS
jgi:hypothetical protein